MYKYKYIVTKSVIQKWDYKLENALRYIGKSEVDEIITKLHKLRGLDGIGNVITDLGHAWYTKFLGSRFVLDYASKLDDALIFAKKVTFEVKEIINFGGKDVNRFYDIVVDGVKYEMKAWLEWQSWSDGVIRKQFIRDLANPDLSKIDELNWVLKKTDGITDVATLKSKVINALKGDLSKIEDAFDEDMVKKLFPTDNTIRRTNYAEKLIENLDKAENFERVFKVTN